MLGCNLPLRLSDTAPVPKSPNSVDTSDLIPLSKAIGVSCCEVAWLIVTVAGTVEFE